MVTFATLVAALAVTLLVGSETLVATMAGAWAFVTMFHLSTILSYGFYGLAAAITLVVMGKVAMMAWDSETDPRNWA
jgi:hypothetical protein